MIQERTKTIEIAAVELDGRTYTELHLIAPRVGWRLEAERSHLRRGDSSEALTNYSVALTAKCASVDARVLAELEDDVFAEAWDWVHSFSRKVADDDAGQADPTRELTLTLPSSATVDGRSYEQLTLHPPRVGWRRQAEGHLRQSQRPDDYTRYAIALIARCAGVDAQVLHNIDDDIFFDAWEWVSGFLAGGQRTGKT